MEKSNTFEQSAAQLRQQPAFTAIQERHLLPQEVLEEEFVVDRLAEDFAGDDLGPNPVIRMLLDNWYADCQVAGRAVRMGHERLLSLLHHLMKTQDWDALEAICGSDYEYGYHPSTQSLIVVKTHFTLIVSSHEESHGVLTIGQSSIEELLWRNPELQPLI